MSRPFDLPSQPLASALEAFGGITGYSVLVSSQLTDGRQSSAVRGELKPDEALLRLLAGTRLVARYVGRNAFTVVPAPSDESAMPDPGLGDETTVHARGPRFSGTPFAADLQHAVTRQLCREQPRLFGRYRIGVQLWINAQGAVRQVRVLASSGVRAQDDAVLADLSSLVLDSPPPPDLAQPVTLLLTARLNPAQDCRLNAGTAQR